MRLPGVLQEFADAAGEDAALAIAKAKGGTTVYFPGLAAFDAGGANWLSDLVGREAALKITAECVPSCGIRLLVPMATHAIRDDKIRKMNSAGKSIHEIALAVGCHQRTVSRVRARIRAKNARALRAQKTG